MNHDTADLRVILLYNLDRSWSSEANQARQVLRAIAPDD